MSEKAYPNTLCDEIKTKEVTSLLKALMPKHTHDHFVPVGYLYTYVGILLAKMNTDNYLRLPDGFNLVDYMGEI